MRRKILLSACLISAVVCGLSAQSYSKTWSMDKWKKPDAYGNVIPNGFRVSSANALCFSKSEDGRGGSGYALKIENQQTNHSNRLVSPPLDFFSSGSGTYKVTFYTKGTGNLSRVYLTQDKSSLKGAESLENARKKLQSSDWKRHDLEIRVSDPSVKYYLFFIINGTDPDDPVLFDDLTVKKQ